MDLPIEQLGKILQSAKRILITGPSNPSVDVISTAVAWRLFLTKQNKQVDLVLVGNLPKLKFLSAVKIHQKLEVLGKFKIVLDIARAKVKQLSYDIKNNHLEINILPEGGSFKNSDVTTASEGYQYDLIIVLGAANLEILGSTFSASLSGICKSNSSSRPIITSTRSRESAPRSSTKRLSRVASSTATCKRLAMILIALV